jgi:transposase
MPEHHQRGDQMSIIETGFKAANIIIGVDTHKSTHVAVAINEQGSRLAAISVPANSKGYMKLNNWDRSLGSVQAYGIEGTGIMAQVYPATCCRWA